jgi:IS5 family transposase
MSRLPDESTILRFRNLREKQALSLQIMEAINAALAKREVMLNTGTVIDATLIAALGSTKNKDDERDPEMHQTKKGNQGLFGMKAHIGVDADSGLVRSVSSAAGNINDVTQGHGLLHGKATVVFADAGYPEADKRPEAADARWHVAMRPSKRRAFRETGSGWGALLEQAEKLKASVRAKVERTFREIKRQFGRNKLRYRAGGSPRTPRNRSSCLRSRISRWLERRLCRGRHRDEYACCAGTGPKTARTRPTTHGTGGKYSCGFIK